MDMQLTIFKKCKLLELAFLYCNASQLVWVSAEIATQGFSVLSYI